MRCGSPGQATPLAGALVVGAQMSVAHTEQQHSQQAEERRTHRAALVDEACPTRCPYAPPALRGQDEQNAGLFAFATMRHNHSGCAMAVESLELESRPPLTVDEFEALAERQGWDEDTPIELLDGELVWMSPTNNPHIGCVNRLTRLFTQRYAETMVLVSVQNPVRAGEYDEPEPDVALLKPRPDYYGSAKATPEDILLLVEVSDKTLRTDLGRKARIYASAGVPE